MSRTLKIYVFFLLVLIAGLVYIDATRPKPVDWKPSYNLKDKIPFGLYILAEESESLLPQNNITILDKTLYEFFENEYEGEIVKNSKSPITLLHICDEYHIDGESTKALFNFVAKGKNAFISTENLPKIYLDSLHIGLAPEKEFTQTMNCWLANRNLGNQKYDLGKGAGELHFSRIDTLKTTILGFQGDDKTKNANFIKVPYKKGTFYIHLQPNAFTNYHLLKDNHAEYAEKVLAFLPKGKTFWLAKDQTGLLESGSPLRYLLSQPALKWAWYLFLIGILVFMIFNAKRRQRVIPIIKPLTNTTVDFTKTIGNLYYQEGNHQNLIDKKIIYFLERIRNEYLIDTTVLDDDFVKKLHAKTGRETKDIEHLVRLINYQRKSQHQGVESDLIEINKAIEKIIS